MTLCFHLAYITIFERPLKLLTIIDDNKSDEIIQKFAEFSLFALLKDITDQSEIKMNKLFDDYVSDLSITQEKLSGDWENVIVL